MTTATVSVKRAPKISVSVKRPVIRLNPTGPPGPMGPQGEVAVDSTVTGAPGTPALVEDLDERRTHALLRFTIPEGIQGIQGEVAVGNTVTLAPGSPATVTDTDARPTHAVLDFGIPEGHPATADAGTTTTGAAGTPALVTNVGTSRNAIFDFVIPQGIQGIQGLQGEVSVDSTVTGAAGTPALVEDLDASPNIARLKFTVPQGIQGIQGIQGEVAVGNTATLPPGSAATVTDSDPSIHKAVLEFGIPEGHPSTVNAGTTVTGAAGTPASVVNVGTTRDAVFDFTIPQGIQGIQGPQSEVIIDSTVTGNPGTLAIVEDLDPNPGVARLKFTIPQGRTGSAAVILGTFYNRTPAELPPDGFIPADWDSPGNPAIDLQFTLGDALIDHNTGHLWSFVYTAIAGGWVDDGPHVGPQGPDVVYTQNFPPDPSDLTWDIWINPEEEAVPPGGGGGGMDQATADARYVNIDGDTMTSKLKIDAGPGAGVPLIELRTNNGTQIISSDGSSYTTFSNGIIVPTLFTASIGFTTSGAQIDMNQGSVIQARKFTTTAATGHIRNYSDYNAGQIQADQGIIHTYDNRSAGGAPQAAFQVHKNGDVTENPFLVSSNGYGWYRNLQPDKVVLSLKAASGQTAKVFQVEDPTGSPTMSVGYDGVLYATIVRVPGCDIWNDGRIYFAGQATWFGGTATEIFTNKPMKLGADATDPLHAATKQQVDAKWTRWSGTQAELDAIATKDPNTLYVVV